MGIRYASHQLGRTLKPEEINKRLQAFNAVNNNKNVVSFQWYYFLIVERLCKAIIKNGWPQENIMQWSGVQVFKKEQKAKRGVTFSFDLILIAEMGDQIRRLRHLVDQDLPLADANILFAFEGPKSRKDVQDTPINPARKPWQVFAAFLQQFGNGGRIFSMMDGLGAIGQAAIALGGYEVIAFEKNTDMWQEAQTIIYDHILSKETHEKSIALRITKQVEVILFSDHSLQIQSALLKLKTDGKSSLTKAEVFLLSRIFVGGSSSRSFY